MIALVLVACSWSELEPEPDTMVFQENAPPRALHLEVEGLPEPGETMTFTVTEAEPFESVWVGMGEVRQVDGTCPPTLGGTCIDLEDARRVALGVADASGTVVLSYALSRPIALNRIMWVQAGAVSGDSNGVARWRLGAGDTSRYPPPDTDTGADDDSDTDDGYFIEHLLYAGFVRDVIARARGGVITGTWRGYVKNHRYLTQCSFAADMYGDSLGSLPACPDCMFAFEVELTNFRETSVIGDCEDYWGVSPDLFPDTTVGFGAKIFGYFPYSTAPMWMSWDGSRWENRGNGDPFYDYYRGRSGYINFYGPVNSRFRTMDQVTPDYGRSGGTNYY